MRQVPERINTYLVIGSGRLATHLAHYFNLLGTPHFQWARKSQSEEQLKELANKSTHIMILINDGSIEGFVSKRPYLTQQTLIHCSGSLSFDGIYGAHPLMTFGKDLYDLSTYQSIPFVTEKEELGFQELFPQLDNPHYELESKLKPLYHSLCVASGNFTSILWNEVFSSFEKQLHLSKEVLLPYMVQTLKNLIDSPETSLTGPLKRGDQLTINKNLQALDHHSLEPIYEAFVNFVNIKKESHDSTYI